MNEQVTAQEPQTQMQSLGFAIDSSQVSSNDILKLDMLSSLETYTKVMFYRQYKKNFIVSKHHKLIFSALQDVVDGKYNKLIINMPPRYGKTETAIKSFISWGFALNSSCRFLHLSYSDTLVYDNSETIRNIMRDDLYKTLFPKSKLKSDKGSAKFWKTDAGGELYAVSTQGQVTGFGAGNMDPEVTPDDYNDLTWSDELNDILRSIDAKGNVFQGAILIDDPMKPIDADSDIVRERINLRFESTLRNRTNSRNTPIIIIMQRLHEHDLCGYLNEVEPEDWHVLSLPAIQVDEDGNESALWPYKHTLEELRNIRVVNPLVFDTQYLQDPTPRVGLMYSEGFGTYRPDELLTVITKSAKKRCYIDTADTGADFLCAIFFVDTPIKVFVTDVIYTDAPMEVTEPLTAQRLVLNDTVDCLIESNSGGRGFLRKVKEIVRTIYKCFKCIIHGFTQTDNKHTRIYTHSAGVQNDIVFPDGWEHKWPLFYNAITSYRKDNKKKQKDDAPDCLTGVYEMHISKKRHKKIRRRN